MKNKIFEQFETPYEQVVLNLLNNEHDMIETSENVNVWTNWSFKWI